MMFEVGKTYKLRNGRKAIVYAIHPNNKTFKPVHGAHESIDEWVPNSWDIDGASVGCARSDWDLMSNLEEQAIEAMTKILIREGYSKPLSLATLEMAREYHRVMSEGNKG
jgi:hypothetical protein